ncbi:microtubule-actin cross-linking factor 1-like isoform X4 [Acipenser ruthenus]|uniref:microtubule-actin cross-linking factor 1-like isoform X4 n=1 Tax=Acipenser ruthenus TaxID=7906 RepID=UPI002741E4A5|nr:microtubule-actin cross-linking factor 1-like isoform X4 [Acipenser ruthenus]
MRFHRLQNVQIALDFLKQRQVKLVNIRNDDITDGNPKLTLGLIWTIILHFQISEIYVSGESGDMTAKERLLLWTQKLTEGYPGIRCTNFTSSWSDGRMFNAILHRYRPDLIDMARVVQQSNRDNLEQAFEIAESLGVTRLLDAEDVDVPSPDEKSVITYVSSIYDAFPKIPEGGEGVGAHEVEQRWSEYQNRVTVLVQWIRQHTTRMSDKSFPQNPVELKALYNEYVHFKECEIPLKEAEKEKIEHLYKLLEVWMEFGRVKLPQGLHPNDVEDEWGKLILEMLEREKALRPAVERLELLLQIANKIQNGALDCEEKLTLAKNTLQADVSHLESGEPVRYEQDVGIYLQECEGLIRQLQVDAQILKDETYYQVEQLVFRIVRLQDELVALKLESTSLYRKGHFTSSLSSSEQGGPRGPGLLTGEGRGLSAGAETLLGGALTWLRRPLTRGELVAVSSSEDEGNLRFVYELLAWVEETQIALERAEWGTDLPSVEKQLETQHAVHSTVEELQGSLQEARTHGSKVSPNFRSSYSETLSKLENQYCKLRETSSLRLHSLTSLHAFVSRATAELIWLNEKEEEELAYDWSEQNPNMTAKRDYFTELREELDEKQEVMRSLQDTAEHLSLENHPAKQTVEAYSAALQTQWQWVQQLCCCVEQHIRDNTIYFQFFSDARDSESYLRSLQDSIKRKYTCERGSRLGRLEDLLQDSMDEKEQLIQYKSSVASLVGRAKTIVQLKPRNPDHTVATSIPIRAICDYRQIEITISKNDECVLEDNSQRTKWKVISPTGNEAMVPSVCFSIPPPNQEGTDTVTRIEQQYQNVMTLWHQLHVNMKSVVSWNYLRKDIQNISSWTLDMVKTQSAQERQQALDHMTSHLLDFLEDSRESELFTLTERLSCEEEVRRSQEHCQGLLESMETEVKDDGLCRSYLSQLHDIRLHLEEAEQRLTRRIQAPPTAIARETEASQDSALRIAEQERMQLDLDRLHSDLGEVSQKCVSFFQQSPSSGTVPELRAELNLAVERMERVQSLSSVYLHRLKTVEVLVRSAQAAESLVKKYESKLSEEEIVPADLSAIQRHREQLQLWCSEAREKDPVLEVLDEEVRRAREAGERLFQQHQERSPELELYQERAGQLRERWGSVRSQIETRQSDLEGIAQVLLDYRDRHGALIRWIEETTAQQEAMQPGQAEDSRVLSEQLSQQTALVVEIERNQEKLDECQTHSKQYCASVKEYELQLMTYRAFVESQQKSQVKRRRVHSSSDAITQEFMELRTRYTALVTLTTQHVKYISEALRRLEDEEKALEEEKQAHVGQVSELLGWALGVKGSLGTPERGDIERSLSQQQAVQEELAARKEDVAEAVRNTQIFLQSKQASKLSSREREQVTAQLDSLNQTYSQLCSQSSQQVQELQGRLAEEEDRKGGAAVAGVIDLGTVEIFPVFQAMQKGLIDQDTGLALLEAQLALSGLTVPDTSETLSLEEALRRKVIDERTGQSLQGLQTALELVDQSQLRNKKLHPVVSAVESGAIEEQMGLKILELQVSAGGLKAEGGRLLSLETASEEGLLTPQVRSKLEARLKTRRELIDPNTAEKLSLSELARRCLTHKESGCRLLPVKQLAGGMVCLKSGRQVSIFRAVQEGLIDRQVTVRLLEAQLFAGGIADPRSGHRLTVDEAVRHGLIDQDMACAILIRQLQTGGVIDPLSGRRLTVDEAVQKDLVASRRALVILESLWSFMGLLWPETGEILPMAEAVQQGVLSTELAGRILGQRKTVGALYVPETCEVVPLEKAAELLGEDCVEVLKGARIPDMMPTMTLSGSPSINRLSWGSSSSSNGGSPPAPRYDPKPGRTGEQVEDPRDEVEQRLLFHLMTHSYIDVHSGQRLVLLDQELSEVACALAVAEAEVCSGGKDEAEMETETDDRSQATGVWEAEESIQILGRTAPAPGSDIARIHGKAKLEELVLHGNVEAVEKQTGKAVAAGKWAAETLEEEGFGKEKLNGEGEVDKSSRVQRTEVRERQKRDGKSKAKKEAMRRAEEELKRERRVQTVEADETEEKVILGFQAAGRVATVRSPSAEEQRAPVSGKPEESHSELKRMKLDKKERKKAGKDKREAEKRSGTDTNRGQSVTDWKLEPVLAVVESEGALQYTGAEWETLMMEQEQMDTETVMHGPQFMKQFQTQSDIKESEHYQSDLIQSQREVKQQSQFEFEQSQPCVKQSQAETIMSSQSQDVRKGGRIPLLEERLMIAEEGEDSVARTVVNQEGEELGGNLQTHVTHPHGSIAQSWQKTQTASRVLQTRTQEDSRAGKPIAASSSTDTQTTGPPTASESVTVDSDEETILEVLASQLREGGIVHKKPGAGGEGRKLLLDEALSLGVLQGHTAVRLMEKLGLFGGFFDSEVCEVLSVDEVLEEGLMDEELMQKVLRSEKSISGVFDASSGGSLCTVQEASRSGLLDQETAARLLEGQVASGGIVDLRRGKKVSVTLASKLGLVEEGTLREDLMKLEKAYKGKGVERETGLRKLELQAEMEGALDPETKEPVPLSQAIERGLVDREQASQVLARQVADGGIIHHGSGMRLSVEDALDRGLIDRDSAQELVEVEKACRQQYVHPETKERIALPQATALGLVDRDLSNRVQEIQAMSGGCRDPDTGARLSLTEAVQRGMLEKPVVDKAMASPAMQRCVLDPERATAVPYSEIVNRARIDIETGQRFLRVGPFRGIRDDVTGDLIPVSLAMKAGRIDPVPALRIMQSQADSGGIIDIATGDRLTLAAALRQGLVTEDMAKLIATNQLTAGGIVSPVSGERTVSLEEAEAKGLITKEMAADIQSNVGNLEESEEGERVHEQDEESRSPNGTSQGDRGAGTPAYSSKDFSSPDSMTHKQADVQAFPPGTPERCADTSIKDSPSHPDPPLITGRTGERAENNTFPSFTSARTPVEEDFAEMEITSTEAKESCLVLKQDVTVDYERLGDETQEDVSDSDERAEAGLKTLMPVREAEEGLLEASRFRREADEPVSMELETQQLQLLHQQAVHQKIKTKPSLTASSDRTEGLGTRSSVAESIIQVKESEEAAERGRESTEVQSTLEDGEGEVQTQITVSDRGVVITEEKQAGDRPLVQGELESEVLKTENDAHGRDDTDRKGEDKEHLEKERGAGLEASEQIQTRLQTESSLFGMVEGSVILDRGMGFIVVDRPLAEEVKRETDGEQTENRVTYTSNIAGVQGDLRIGDDDTPLSEDMGAVGLEVQGQAQTKLGDKPAKAKLYSAAVGLGEREGRGGVREMEAEDDGPLSEEVSQAGSVTLEAMRMVVQQVSTAEDAALAEEVSSGLEGERNVEPSSKERKEREALLLKAKESIRRKVYERAVSEKQAAEELEAMRRGAGLKERGLGFEGEGLVAQGEGQVATEVEKKKESVPTSRGTLESPQKWLDIAGEKLEMKYDDGRTRGDAKSETARDSLELPVESLEKAHDESSIDGDLRAQTGTRLKDAAREQTKSSEEGGETETNAMGISIGKQVQPTEVSLGKPEFSGRERQDGTVEAVRAPLKEQRTGQPESEGEPIPPEITPAGTYFREHLGGPSLSVDSVRLEREDTGLDFIARQRQGILLDAVTSPEEEKTFIKMEEPGEGVKQTSNETDRPETPEGQVSGEKTTSEALDWAPSAQKTPSAEAAVNGDQLRSKESKELLLEKIKKELKLGTKLERRPEKPVEQREAGPTTEGVTERPQDTEPQSQSREIPELTTDPVEGEDVETPQGEGRKPAKLMKPSLSRQQCLEHDERLVAFLSLVLHIELRLKEQQQQPMGSSVSALQESILQTEALDSELSSLSEGVARELDCVASVVASPPPDVPAQLLLALEKDARNLQRSYSAVQGVSQARLQGLRTAQEQERCKLHSELQSLEGRARALQGWLGEMGGAESPGDPPQLTHNLQHWQELKAGLAERSASLDSIAFDIQLFISERAQDLTPQQSRQLLRQLNELQRSFREASGHVAARTEALLAAAAHERETEKETKAVQQQQQECARKLDELALWLAEASSTVTNRQAESGGVDDVTSLQQKQSDVKALQNDIQSRSDSVVELIKSTEEFLSESGPRLSPGDRAAMERKLSAARGQYATLRESSQAVQRELDSALSTALQQQSQKEKAAEALEVNQSQIGELLSWVSTLGGAGTTLTQGGPETARHQQALGSGMGAMQTDSSASLQPEESLESQCERLQAHHKELLSQQPAFILATKSAQAFLDRHGESLAPGEKERLSSDLARLRAQYEGRLSRCEAQLKRAAGLREELDKFLTEHGEFSSWLELSEQELRSLGEGQSDAQGLRERAQRHRKFSEDVICHKADLRFITISGQKVLDAAGAGSGTGEGEPELDPSSTRLLVQGKLQDATDRFSQLHAKCSELGSHLTRVLELYQQYQDETGSLETWLLGQEQNCERLLSDTTDPESLQRQLNMTKDLQGELEDHRAQVERLKRAMSALLESEEQPRLSPEPIRSTADSLLTRFESLSQTVSERSDKLQTAVAQSQSMQEGLGGLLDWLGGVEGSLRGQDRVQPSARAVQEALTHNQKLGRDLLSRQCSVEATRQTVAQFLQTADASTATGLQGELSELCQRFGALRSGQEQKEAELRGVLPKLETFERLASQIQEFTETRGRALGTGSQPERDMQDFNQRIEELRGELTQEADSLGTLRELGAELSDSGVLADTHRLQDTVREVSEQFTRLETNVKQRAAEAQSCQLQMDKFRSLVGALQRWLQGVREQLPATEPALSTEGLETRVQELKALLSDWESQGARVQEMNRAGSELETLIIEITAPRSQSRAGPPQLHGADGTSSVNGIHTCKDLTEIQCSMADAGRGYESVGAELGERLGLLGAMLEQRLGARREAASIASWLKEKEQTLSQQQLHQRGSPSKTEAVQEQALQNKALLAELEQHSGKVEDLKQSLRSLIESNPDSPEAESWRKTLQDIDTMWLRTTQTASERQAQLEQSASMLVSFTTAESQLRPWLNEKELMMSVLGPLSIDPNMLGTQRQQVQFMLKEFETRRPQFHQLTQSAEGILHAAPSGAEPGSPSCEMVREQLAAVTGKWEELTSRLDLRSEHIDQAQGTSARYQALLGILSTRLAALGERLDSQAALSTQPDALQRQLEETSGIRAELEQSREELGEARELCEELSQLIGEPYLREELRKRLEAVSAPFRSLEERAAEGINQLQSALSSSQQFQQMFDELRTWLDKRRDELRSSPPISGLLGPLKDQLQEQEDFQKGLNQQRGTYELIQSQGQSLLLSVGPGEERGAVQAQLGSLRQHWEELGKETSERQGQLRECLGRAERYQQHRQELLPWIESCEARAGELEVSLDPEKLERGLQKAKALGQEAEKRRSLLETLNASADLLIEACEAGEEEVRDQKAEANRRMDSVSELLQSRTAALEEMAGRLKEFRDSLGGVERRLEAARHQLEIQEALGPQACSGKSMERMRAQLEGLQAVQPQVEYLRDLARGLLEDAPTGGQTEDCALLDRQACDAEREFNSVREKLEECCSVLEGRLQGVSQVQTRVRDAFSRLADLDDELDGMAPVARDPDSLQSQAEDVRLFLSRLDSLRAELQGCDTEAQRMLQEGEGASPDLLALKRELEALSRQGAKLGDRAQGRLEQVEGTGQRLEEFYAELREVNALLGTAEEGQAAQGVVGSEVEVISQQLADFKVFQKEQVEPLQPRLQQANGAGQGLIQSAGKNSDTQGLEHELQETNARWNTLNKRVAERITHLQEALLHCGKFQDALEPLLSWLTDTEELIANQRPPSAEYKVVKAQIQEQKLLQRLLDDRRGTVEMIKAEGERIAQSAEPSDQEKIRKQLESLGESWRALLSKADTRQSQLEELLVLAKQFHETTEPLGEWLSATEKKLANSEPVGTQTSKINQQITQHKALSGEISGRSSLVDRAVSLGASLSLLSCPSDRARLSELLQGVQEGYREVRERACRKGALLEQALANARIFGEDEVEVLNWLAEVQDRLEGAAVRDFRQAVLHRDHSIQLTLNEEIVTRRKNVDQAVKNGQALLKQTTGEEVIVIQEKLDGIKTRYADITAASSRALRTLEQALQLSTRFSSTHQELCDWLNGVEEELNQSGGQSPSPEQIPRFHERQKELKNAATEQRLVLDTVNEVSSALLELVPWRAREGLDRLVSEANERFRSVSDIIAQRVQQIDAAIQRSQKYEQAADAELAWVSETERKLSALGPIRLQQDQTTAQIQVQKAFSIDIIRHKDSIDELLATREEILGTCGEEQKAGLQRKTDSLLRQYDAVSQLNLDRYAQLERAQVLVNQFWETHEELLPWLQETQTLLGQLPGPAINHEALRQQQEEMKQLRESISEHKPHIDKLLKIGPQLEELNPGEGEMVRERYGEAGRCYTEIKEVVKRRATALDEAVSQSTQFHDKIEPMLETLEHLQSRLHQPPAIPAEVDKIREQLGDNKGLGLELEKLQPSFQALCSRGEELLARSQGPDKDPAAKEIRDRLDRLRFCWDDIRARAEEREGKLLDVLDLAEKFWYDMTALLSTIRDTQDIVKELEEPSIDPSLIKQQIEAAQAIKSETDGLREELEFVRILGADLIFACGETEKPEVKKTIDEMNSAWEGLNRTWKERMDQLEEAMAAAVQYQDALQGMFDYLDNAVIRLCDMSPVGTDVSTIKQQIEELKLYKVDVYQQQIDMERLNHQGELMLKKAMDDTDRVITQEPLTELRHLWDNLGEKIIHRQHKLEGALLALGQFQHALSELQSWLTHTTEMLDAQRPISTDPKAIEIELAKHHVLRNDVLSHRSTVDTVNKAGRELQESSAGDEASHLKQRLQRLNSSWEAVLLRTQERQGQLEAALQQAEGFHGEVEDFLQWLRRSESQLAASKPTGGLPETAREQLQQHMELQSQFAAREELYLSLLDKGHRMLLSREDPGAGSNTEQNLTLLEHKWEALRSKMEERKGKLEEALSLATGFQSSLQDFINWLTQAEQILNLAQPPSLLLDTVLFQIDEHKVFVNEVNTHRDQILALDKAGVQLKFSSQKQDVVLIKNLLLSMQGRWEKVVQRSLERGRALDEARKRAKQFHEAWRKLSDWLEEAEKQLNSELEISNDPDKIKLQLSQHKEFQKTLGGKQPVYDTMARSGRSMKEKASQPEDRQRLDNLLGEVRDKWDTVCGKSVERQHKLEEALLFSGQFADALQALVDWLYRVEPQLSEEQPVHGDVDLVSNLLDAHKVFQKELGKRTGSVQALKRSARELIDTARDDTTWVKVQLQELSTRWDSVCSLSVIKQTRLEQALKQAEEFRAAVQQLLEWLSEAEQTLRFRGLLPDERDTLQSLIDLHKEFMKNVEEKRVDVNKAAGMGEEILTVCHPDCITTIKHWITIIRARFEEVMTWAKQHQQRLETALAELVNNAELLDQLLSWLQWAETTLIQRDQEPLPQNIELVKERIAEHQSFMEEMTRKQPDVDKVTKTYKRKTAGPSSLSLAEKSRARKALPHSPSPLQLSAQSELKSPRVTQLSARWQQVWLLALDRQRKLNDALDRLEELKEFANFDFDVWRKKYMRWMNHKKSRVMDFFRRIDRDQDGKITRQEFIDGILASKFPTSKLEMMAVADIFDGDGDGYIDYYEFVAALHPNKDAYRPTTDADKIEDEVTRQVAQCKCAKRFQVEQIGENKYRFGDSQQLRLVRILRSTVMVRVGGGWMALDEFLVKNDPCRVTVTPGYFCCRARGRTNLELREKFILPEGMSQGMAAFRSRGRKSKPSSRAASPTRSSSSASQSNHSCTSVPSSPATPASGSRTPHTYSRGYDKPWLVNSKSSTPGQFPSCPDHQSPSEVTSGSKLKRPTFHSSRGSLTGENGNQGTPTSAKSNRSESKRGASSVSRPSSRAGSRAGSRASSRRGSDASDFDLLETQSACSDVSETSASGATRRGGKPSKIPTISKKTTSPSSSSSTTSPKTPGNKR